MSEDKIRVELFKPKSKPKSSQAIAMQLHVGLQSKHDTWITHPSSVLIDGCCPANGGGKMVSLMTQDFGAFFSHLR